MQQCRSSGRKRFTKGAGDSCAVALDRVAATPASHKVEAQGVQRLQRRRKPIDRIQEQGDTVLCPQATATMRAFAEWVRRLDRNAYLRRLFPDDAVPCKQERVAARIQRHFPEVTLEDVNRMDSGEMLVYLKRVWETEQATSGAAT